MPEPTLPASFEWVDQPWGRALQCRPLALVAPHLFTTRQLTLGGPDGNADEGWRALAAAFKVDRGRLAQLTQVHGTRVVAVPEEAGAARPSGTWADGDALITEAAGFALAVKAADCVPLLIGDRRRGVVAAIHAGWRGTAAGVAAATVLAMGQRYGSRPADLEVAVGPSIGPCCYQVGTDVCDAFLEAGADPHDVAEWFMVSPAPSRGADLGLGSEARKAGTAVQAGRLWLDTWQANSAQLMAAGVPPGQIHVAGLCTACYPDLLHSYRVDGARAGRMAGAIAVRLRP